MSAAQKKTASFLLFLAGVGLLGMNYFRTNGYEPGPSLAEPPKPYKHYQAMVEPDSIVSARFFVLGEPGPSLENVDILAVFCLTSKVCPGCINEVIEYSDLMQDLENEGLAVEAVVFLGDEDLARARHFTRAVNLPMPVGYGYPGVLDALLERNSTGAVSSQLVFVDVGRHVAFFGTRVFSVRTPLEQKEAILDVMIRANEQRSDAAALR